MTLAFSARVGRGVLAVVLTGLGMLVPRIALAQPATFRLEWSAPAGCPEWREALARIEALLGARVDEVRHAPLTVHATITKSDERFTIVLETLHNENRFERTLEAKTCSEVTDAGALVIALAIDPTLAERRKPDAPPPAAPQKAPPCPKAPAPVPCPKSAPVTRVAVREVIVERVVRGSSWSVQARALLDVGTLPNVGFGPEFGVVGRVGWFQAGVFATWLAPQRAIVREDGLAQEEKGGDLSLFAAELRACAAPFRKGFTGRVCAGFEAGFLEGEGVGTELDVSAASGWFAPTAHVAGGYAFSERVGAELSASAVVPLERTEFVLENVGKVHQPSALVLRFGIGANVHF